MHRLTLLIAVAACGGSSKPPPSAPLPETKQATPAPASDGTAASQSKTAPEASAEAKPEAPAKPAGPVEVKLPALQTTVKIVSAGKGKKEPLRYTAKQGAKQA